VSRNGAVWGEGKLEDYVQRILSMSDASSSEAKLQIDLEAILKALLADYDIAYIPAVNESLKKLGLSQVNSGRPDSVFGHVVLDYKEAGLLGVPGEFELLRYLLRGRLHVCPLQSCLDGTAESSDISCRPYFEIQ